VKLVESRRFPREKSCGDALTPSAVHALATLGLEKQLSGFHPLDSVRVFTSRGMQLERGWQAVIDGERVDAVMAPRYELDAMLLKAAGVAGVEVELEAVADDVLRREDEVCGIRLAGSDDPLLARLTVAADGARSRLARAAGCTASKTRYRAVATRFVTPSRRSEHRTIDIFLAVSDGDDVLAGYGWVFPEDDAGTINVGVGMFPTRAGFRGSLPGWLRTFCRSLPQTWDVPAESWRSSLAWPIPTGISFCPPGVPGMLLVGDALGAANPVGAEGIGPAIRTGILAAESALAEDPLAAYSEGLPAILGRRNRVALGIAKLFFNRMGMATADRLVARLARGQRTRVTTSAARAAPATTSKT
jgi:flavin-dependent dehydrogenase